ncbi:MAG TPA: hypothetical protein VHY84_27420 [Bryobacteraceae bacterium]|jgi:hypothetical protein|nr:hypothetical protein [Bryobacteraceae bacterium]
MIKRLATIALSLCAAISAQTGTPINTLNIIPNATHTAVGSARFYNQTQTNYSAHQAPASLSATQTITDYVVGTAGCVQDNGFGLQSVAACGGGGSTAFSALASGINTSAAMIVGSGASLSASGAGTIAATSLVAPATISGTSSSPILTLTQSGSGPALQTSGGNVGIGGTPSFLLDVFGAENLRGNLSLSADNAYNMFGPSLAPAALYTHQITELGLGGLFTGTLTDPAGKWYLAGDNSTYPGLHFGQAGLFRYVINSQGDIPQTGTINISAGGVVTTSTGFDPSWAGGNLLICSTSCSTSNGALYRVSNSPLPTSTTLTIVGWAGGGVSGYSYSYTANAFQTSTGTMGGTGAGYWHAQGYEAAGGYLANVGTLTGSVTCSGSNAIWNSGVQFDQSWVGGIISISSVNRLILAFLTTTEITLDAPCTSGSYIFVQYGFSNANRSFHVDSVGDAFATTLTAGTGALGGVLTFSSGELLINSLTSSVPAMEIIQGGVGSGLVISGGFGPALSVSGGATNTLVVTGNSTFSGSISVGSCAGCGGGVSAGIGITVSGSTVTLNQTPAYGTAALNYFTGSNGGLKLFTSDFQGPGTTTPTPGTYGGNQIPVYNSSGGYMGFIALF